MLRAVRRVATGRSPDKVLSVAPADARRWVRNHPALFDVLVTSERRELAGPHHA